MNENAIGETSEKKTTFQDLKNELFKHLEGKKDRKVAELIFKQYRIDSIQKDVANDDGENFAFEVNYSNKHTKEKHKWAFI